MGNLRGTDGAGVTGINRAESAVGADFVARPPANPITLCDGHGVDADPVPADTPIRGLRARDRYLTSDQRVALHQLRRPRPPLNAKAAEVLDVIARDPRALTECHPDLDPEGVIALQQRGIIRRHPRGDSLELTDDAQFSLAPEMPHISRSEH
jgi:hypothetical protein